MFLGHEGSPPGEREVLFAGLMVVLEVRPRQTVLGLCDYLLVREGKPRSNISTADARGNCTLSLNVKPSTLNATVAYSDINGSCDRDGDGDDDDDDDEEEEEEEKDCLQSDINKSQLPRPLQRKDRYRLQSMAKVLDRQSIDRENDNGSRLVNLYATNCLIVGETYSFISGFTKPPWKPPD
ncbi:unnamed protein product [Soboliphyme baturini]|uniref:Uncharacterized protein n=1 Tax=Soboliphyme baturini TaxID=241478 RepID=A0A183IQI4_9BILA|nr:unnamed protein product [Soboliphyme baturini]